MCCCFEEASYSRLYPTYPAQTVVVNDHVYPGTGRWTFSSLLRPWRAPVYSQPIIRTPVYVDSRGGYARTSIPPVIRPTAPPQPARPAVYNVSYQRPPVAPQTYRPMQERPQLRQVPGTRR